MMSWEEFLTLPRSEYFWTSRCNGQYACGNPSSYYLNGADPEEASYDTGNNRAMTLSGINGELKQIALFKESYYADHAPGVWVHKGRILAGPFHFSLNLSGEEVDLPNWSGKVRTDLVETVIPLTTYTLKDLCIRVTAFAPLSADGEKRPRGAFYVAEVENTSTQRRSGTLVLPQIQHFAEVGAHGNNVQLDMVVVPQIKRMKTVPFDLHPGEKLWVPIWIFAYGEPIDPDIRRGAEYWAEETLAYYRALNGGLTLPEQPFAAEMMTRTLCQCQQCVGMDASGEIAGSSWGTNPITCEIWMKDMYYSMLPLARTDPEFFRKGMEWFAKYGVRPEGVQFEGGIFHSLSNSLSSIIMAGVYYEVTGDGEYFRTHPALIRKFEAILDEMIASRKNGEPWLFRSVWISDGLCMGDYHTGTNITAWAALVGFARILREAVHEADRAEAYDGVAERVRQAILEQCVIEGPYGTQFCEGVGKGSPELQAKMKADSEEEFKAKNDVFGIQYYEFFNRKDDAPYLVHDGEETDTTLASYYGLLPYDSPIMKNYTRFAMTEENRFYCKVSKGIIWENCTDSTFPGYITGLSNAVDRPTFEKYFGVIASLADLDGSIWWWPYPHSAEDHSVMKRSPGKCGWASGEMMALMQSDLFGLRYDAVSKRLSYKPLDVFGRYSWKNVPMGAARFDVEYAPEGVRIRNDNSTIVEAEIQLFGHQMFRDDKPISCNRVQYCGKDAVAASFSILPGEELYIKII